MTTITNPHFTDLNNLSLTIRLGGYQGEFLYWGFYAPEYWRNYWHVHSFFEVCYAYQGQGAFRIGDQLHAVSAGDLFMARPDEPHEIIASQDDPLGIYFWAYTLSPSARSQAAPIKSGENSDQELNELLHLYTNHGCTVSQKVGTLPTTLQQLATEITNRPPGYRAQIQALTTSLLIETARAAVTTEITGAPLVRSGNAAVDTMVRYLRDNYDRPLQIRDVAAQLHMSERHTSRLFRQTMGQSIQQYLTELRLTVAKQQLLDPRNSVSEIATSLGFSDVRHFATRFRQLTGATPTAFRAMRGTSFTPEGN
jgi:AraC family L-rhamnose operon transcriptional activator RhaR